LLEAVRAGSREAAEAVVHRHHAGVYRFLLHLTRDVDRAEDLTPETFASAWRRIGGFAGRSGLGTWLHRIAFGKFVDARRGRLRAEAAINRLALSRPGAINDDPSEAIRADERSQRLYDTVHALDEAERVVVVLHYFQGLSFREVAEVVRRPVGTVKWRTSRALARLREQLGEDFDDAGRASFTASSGNGVSGVGPP
jgi:RNA polymerase sigma factor (sigma-70 family)